MNTNATSPQADLRMKRIQKVSTIVRAFCMIAQIVLVSIMAIGMIDLAFLILNWSGPKLQHTLWGCRGFLVLPFLFMVTRSFFHLFTRLQGGHLFDLDSIRYLENACK